MSKGAKTCSIITLISILLFSCSLISLVSGVAIGDTISETDIPDPVIEEKITEKKVFVEPKTTARYIDEENNPEIFRELITESANHFDFEYSVDIQEHFVEDKDFILANLENQYARLSVKFNKELPNNVKVKLVDDIDTYSNDLNVIYETDYPTFAAFAQGGQLVEIYLNPDLSIDKFDLANGVSHELVHIFQFHINYTFTVDAPDWFIEGMADSFAYPKEEPLIHQDTVESIPDLDTLDSKVMSTFPDDYLTGYDISMTFFTYLVDTYGEEKVMQLTNIGYTTNYYTNFTQVIGSPAETVFAEWKETI